MKEFEKWISGKTFYKQDTELGISACFAWKAAFTNIQQWLMGRRCTEEDVLDYVNQELSGK